MLRLRVGDESIAACGDTASERTRANTERRLTSDNEDENDGNEDFSSAFVSMQNSSSLSSGTSSSVQEEE